VTGAVRLHIGKGHELDVTEKLAAHGWIVHPWGQGLFEGEAGEHVRQALVARQPKTYWRWIPDLIAVKGTRLMLVDPKTDLTDTPNFSIEIDAYIAHLAMSGFGLPVVYVWQDMTCNTPGGLFVHKWFAELQRGATRGSGTPFGLVSRADQKPFEWAFGPRIALPANSGRDA